MLSQISMLNILRQGTRRICSRPANQVAKTSLPFVSMDWFFPRFPEISADKFRWMMRYLQGSFLAGAVFVFFVYHTPYAGADYENEWHSPLYNWTMKKMKSSGELEKNLSIKRTTFYDEE